MLDSVDAVHGLYYLLMHGWFQIFPATEFWSRAPSGLAVGGAAAGVVVLGKQLSSRTAAVSAGAVCAILPRATWAGIEARPYAFSMMAAVWLPVLLVYATRRNTAWVWLAYGVVAATATFWPALPLRLECWLLRTKTPHPIPGRGTDRRGSMTCPGWISTHGSPSDSRHWYWSSWRVQREKS